MIKIIRLKAQNSKAKRPPGPLPKNVNFEENECVIDDIVVRSSDVKKQLLRL